MERKNMLCSNLQLFTKIVHQFIPDCKIIHNKTYGDCYAYIISPNIKTIYYTDFLLKTSKVNVIACAYHEIGHFLFPIVKERKDNKSYTKRLLNEFFAELWAFLQIKKNYPELLNSYISTIKKLLKFERKTFPYDSTTESLEYIHMYIKGDNK